MIFVVCNVRVVRIVYIVRMMCIVCTVCMVLIVLSVKGIVFFSAKKFKGYSFAQLKKNWIQKIVFFCHPTFLIFSLLFFPPDKFKLHCPTQN